MHVTQLRLISFRNYRDQTVTFGSGQNVLYGRNAQGKTNLLEALYILSSAKSFRQGRERDWIAFGSTSACVIAHFEAYGQSHTIEMRLLAEDGRKQMLVEGFPIQRNSDLAAVFCTVLFEPGHLGLVKEGPEERRAFLDGAIGQLRPGYHRALDDYGRVVAQKNALLRQGGRDDLLAVYNARQASIGSQLVLLRSSYVKKMTHFASEHHSRLSGGAEQLVITYETSCGAHEEREAIRDALYAETERRTAEERERGMALVGPHRDDLSIRINGQSARLFGSQGQQRSVALSMKLAECAMAEAALGEPPILLLDDVMSELDAARRRYLRHQLRDRQVILTTCVPARPGKRTAVFRVSDGAVTPVTTDPPDEAMDG